MNNYTEAHIKTLKGLEPVKKRPGMYIGNTAFEGLHHLAVEVIDNAVDEALAGYARSITVELHKQNQKVVVSDDGRGIPVGIHPEEKRPTLEVVLTTLHSGAKFDNSVYKTSGGLHGVGLSVVNALSKWLRVTVCRDGYKHVQEYAYGNPLTGIKKEKGFYRSGTRVEFIPDFSKFSVKEFNEKIFKKRLEELQYLTPKVVFLFKVYGTDRELEVEERFYSERGLYDFVDKLRKDDEKAIVSPSYVELNKDSQSYRICFVVTDRAEEKCISFVNNIRTIDGGTHVTLYRTAFARALSNFVKSRKDSFDSDIIEETRKSIISIIDVRLTDPLFESQTKVKLRNTDISKLFLSDLIKQFRLFFEENSTEILDVLQVASEAVKQRKRFREQIKNLKKKIKKQSSRLPVKLADCTCRDVSKRELFLVEGDSAGGSLKKCKDDKTQAVLPLRGKVLNVERAVAETILANEELLAIASAIGLDLPDLENGDFREMLRDSEYVAEQIKKLRYSKMIIMTDADADGYHIRALLLSYLYTFFPYLIETGKVYVVEPPLYRIKMKNKSIYCKDDQALEEALKDVKGNYVVQRFKGLGEMNPEELFETCVDPQKRVLIEVQIEDARRAAETIKTLFGDSAQARRDFIQEYSNKVSAEVIYS